MSLYRKIKMARKRRALRTRARLTLTVPRVSVFRSLQHIYAQLIDDKQQRTLASASSVELRSAKGNKKEIAFAVGKELAQKARAQGIEAVVFDRGPFLFHGRVRSVADGLREGGLHV